VSWFGRHLNWSLLLVYVCAFSLVAVAAWSVPFPPNLVYFVLMMVMGSWLLGRKGRSKHHLWLVVLVALGLSLGSQRGHYDMSAYVGYTLGAWLLPVVVWVSLRNKKAGVHSEQDS